MVSLFPRSNPLRPSRSLFDVSNEIQNLHSSKQPLDKSQSAIFSQAGVMQTHFQNLKEKREWFFDQSTSLIVINFFKDFQAKTVAGSHSTATINHNKSKVKFRFKGLQTVQSVHEGSKMC